MQWLKTDLGTEQADLEVNVGTKAVLDAEQLDEYNGTFRNILVSGWENNEGPNKYDGKMVPW